MDILLGIRDAGPGFRKQFPDTLMCIVSGIKMFSRVQRRLSGQARVADTREALLKSPRCGTPS